MRRKKGSTVCLDELSRCRQCRVANHHYHQKGGEEHQESKNQPNRKVHVPTPLLGGDRKGGPESTNCGVGRASCFQVETGLTRKNKKHRFPATNPQRRERRLVLEGCQRVWPWSLLREGAILTGSSTSERKGAEALVRKAKNGRGKNTQNKQK